ncbi:MAG: hypothetical protein GY807_04985 [Gammaproteobacteria bacterium]|nr:hypothetical protein [Gammaproteobacteria bacterium]
MAKKKKPRTSKKPTHYTPNLSPQRYERYYLALEEGEVAAHADDAVYWDLGPGERPDKVLADMRYVAKKENIPVKIMKGHGRFLKLFYLSDKPQSAVRVRRGDEVITEFCQSEEMLEQGLPSGTKSDCSSHVFWHVERMGR